MNLDALRSLADAWRSEADLFRRRGLEGEACLVESYAAELEQRLSEWWLENLTLEEAASEVGLAYDTLQRRVSRGALPNVGRKGSPLVRRCDLHGANPDPESGLSSSEDPDLAGRILRGSDMS